MFLYQLTLRKHFSPLEKEIAMLARPSKVSSAAAHAVYYLLLNSNELSHFKSNFSCERMLGVGRLIRGVGGLFNTVSQTIRGGYPISHGQTLGLNTSLVNATIQSNPQLGLVARCMATLGQMHRAGAPWIKTKKCKNPLGYNVPFMKGVVIRPVIRKPKKPNSANRKCVLVRLSNGKETVAYVPKEGHNLQEHNIVLVRVGKLKDCSGVKVRCVRGKYDLPHPEKKTPVQL